MFWRQRPTNLLVIFSHWLFWFFSHFVGIIFLFLSQPVGCDHELGSKAVLDACGVCKGDNSTCKFYKGLYLNQHKANGKRCMLFHCCWASFGQAGHGRAVYQLAWHTWDDGVDTLARPREGGWFLSVRSSVHTCSSEMCPSNAFYFAV